MSKSLKAFKTIANKIRKKIPGSRPLMDGEIHFLGANFLGPGTRIDLPKVRGTSPLNKPDSVAMQHDIDFLEISKMDISDKEKKQLIREADNKLIKAMKDMGKLEGIDELYRQAGLKGIQFKRGLEDVSPTLTKQLLPPDLIGEKIPDVSNITMSTSISKAENEVIDAIDSAINTDEKVTIEVDESLIQDAIQNPSIFKRLKEFAKEGAGELVVTAGKTILTLAGKALAAYLDEKIREKLGGSKKKKLTQKRMRQLARAVKKGLPKKLRKATKKIIKSKPVNQEGSGLLDAIGSFVVSKVASDPAGALTAALSVGGLLTGGILAATGIGAVELGKKVKGLFDQGGSGQSGSGPADEILKGVALKIKESPVGKLGKQLQSTLGVDNEEIRKIAGKSVNDIKKMVKEAIDKIKGGRVAPKDPFVSTKPKLPTKPRRTIAQAGGFRSGILTKNMIKNHLSRNRFKFVIP